MIFTNAQSMLVLDTSYKIQCSAINPSKTQRSFLYINIMYHFINSNKTKAENCKNCAILLNQEMLVESVNFHTQ